MRKRSFLFLLIAEFNLFFFIGCVKESPLEKEPGDHEPMILTHSNHPTGYMKLSCFTQGAGCHYSGDYFFPSNATHSLPELSCCDPYYCHGYNGENKTLVTGTIFVNDTGSIPAEKIKVVAWMRGSPDLKFESYPTDDRGKFSMVIDRIGSYDFILEDELGNKIKTEEFPDMQPSTYDATQATSMDCSACHNKKKDPVIYLKW